MIPASGPPLLNLSCPPPPDLGRPLGRSEPGPGGVSSLGTNPGRRCGGTNLLVLGCGEGKSLLSWLITGRDESGEAVPVRPSGRSEIASGGGSDRSWVWWIGLGGG